MRVRDRWGQLRDGFSSLAVGDRLAYGNLDPLVALAAVAPATQRTRLTTGVLNVGYRPNAALLAKQLAGLDCLSGGRLVVGLGLGAWPDDLAVSGIARGRRGQRLDSLLEEMRRVWSGERRGWFHAVGPETPTARPRLLIGGSAAATFARVAEVDGWIGGVLDFDSFLAGAAKANEAWQAKQREGRPRLVALRYFAVGADSERIAETYIDDFYGDHFREVVLKDTCVGHQRVIDEVARFSAAGCDELIFAPCSADLDQVKLLADALSLA